MSWTAEVMSTGPTPEGWTVYEEKDGENRIAIRCPEMASVKVTWDDGRPPKLRLLPNGGLFNPLDPWGTVVISGVKYKLVGCGQADSAEEILARFNPAAEVVAE